MFHIHRWSKWEIYKESNITARKDHLPGEWYYGPEEKPRTVGLAIIQKRTCLKCGKIETDMQEEYL